MVSDDKSRQPLLSCIEIFLSARKLLKILHLKEPFIEFKESSPAAEKRASGHPRVSSKGQNHFLLRIQLKDHVTISTELLNNGSWWVYTHLHAQ